MSKDDSSSSSSSLRFASLNLSKSTQHEANENDFENCKNSIHFPPPRTPLNAIPDPSQFQKKSRESEFESGEKFEGARAARSPSDRKIEALDSSLSASKGIGIAGTPTVFGRGRAHSESTSAQSTPARSASKASSLGAMGVWSGPRPPQNTGTKGGSSFRVSRGISSVTSEPSVEVSHFELVEDPSFWMDHNVQVLIRIRPISTVESALRGYGRCLRQDSAQTLVWLGHPETRFTFDHIACEAISQEKLFRVVGLPMVENCMSGYNSCMFAYGQTGSGKTHTMMGEIQEMEDKLTENCGITPRIFEYLFTRIKAEEENRRDENLKFSCKCSFLQIYNEQITDLLEPSSTNLQLREDLKKGVYVENLTEYRVATVNDVVKLLLQGAANRKMAATNMNSESSRSHSVFTCIIESQWEKDSMTHLRFGRLNLVDLAGSERQKSSGAEGDRLKEAANINKSLSTLSLVIMSLVDLAHGRHRHVPYRDSRLTFLLQDSLGGNSKTTIIANVSPSTCSANETLSTLKFAQRAKLIQNNAKVNEDASGDVTALQQQIQQLKDQLSFFMKHHNLSTSHCMPQIEEPRLSAFLEEYGSSAEELVLDSRSISSVENEKIKCMEANLVGALRREKMAEATVRKLEAEIAHINYLAQQREENAQRTKMMLRFREEKIKRLESFADGSISADKYLMDENNALLEEIQLLKARIDRSPELIRFALENMRLLQQLQMFQDFYEQGERETLVAEVSELRDQLLETLEGNHELLKFPLTKEDQDNATVKDLEDCRIMNSQLIREVDELRAELGKYLKHGQAASDSVTDSLSKDHEECKQTDKCSLVQTISIRSGWGEEADTEVLKNKNDQEMDDPLVFHPSDSQKELMDARLLPETKESKHTHLSEEPQIMEEYHRKKEILVNRGMGERQSVLSFVSHSLEKGDMEHENMRLLEGSEDISQMALQEKLNRMSEDLKEAQLLIRHYQEDHAAQLSHRQQVELVSEQVELETAKTILHLQEEVAALQLEFHEKLHCMAQENMRLRNTVTSKEDEIRVLCAEWERATLELTSFLIDGSKSLKKASGQIESIACSFPQANVWIGEHVERAAKVCIEKEKTILLLQRSLEDAQNMVLEMELKFSSLKGATVALTEFRQLENDENTKEAVKLTTLLNEKINMIKLLESQLKLKEDRIIGAERCANAAFLVVKNLSECHMAALRNNPPLEKLIICSEMGSHHISELKADPNFLSMEDIEVQLELAHLGVLESENAIRVSCADAEMYLLAVQTKICEALSVHRELVQEFAEDIHEMRDSLKKLKEKHKNSTAYSLSLEANNIPKLENHRYMHLLHQIKNELAETNERLNSIRACINMILKQYSCQVKVEDLVDAYEGSADCFRSGSDLSDASIASNHRSDRLTSTCCRIFSGKINERKLDLKFEEGSMLRANNKKPQSSKMLVKTWTHDETTILCLRKELQMAFYAFKELYVQLDSLVNFEETEVSSYADNLCFTDSLVCVNNNQQHIPNKGIHQLMPGTSQMLPSIELRREGTEADLHNSRELVADEKVNHTNSFLTKFEEAHVIIREADLMLNALLKANENAKLLNVMWKQEGEELMVEKASLIKEVEQLKSSVQMKEEENKILQDHIHYILEEMTNSMSLLEGYLLQMRRDVEERFKVIYSNALSIGLDALNCICSLRSSVEDICSEIVEKGLALFVLYHCNVGKFSCKSPSINEDSSFLQFGNPECHSIKNNLQNSCFCFEDDFKVNVVEGIEGRDQGAMVRNLEKGKDTLMHENLSLREELERKEFLLKGLLFDFSLLQESTSNSMDIKDETEKLFNTLSQAQHELEKKTSQLADTLLQHEKLEHRLADTETALLTSNSDLQQAKEKMDFLSNQNAELRMVLKDLYLKKSEAEDQLEEQKEVIKGLEKEILRLSSSVEKNVLSSTEDMKDDLRRVTSERNRLVEEVGALNDKLDMVYALADENEAIAVEARQESEASKLYAEQKEEEVKILERSVEELEFTINVLEKKVCEMNGEVDRHQLIRDSLEQEIQSLRQRLLSVEYFAENIDSENLNAEEIDHQISRKLHSKLLELDEAHDRIRVLEEERVEQAKEIKQCKDYISELVVHAEAQASQYQQKYKTLEAMFREVKTHLATSTSTQPKDKTDKSMRTRGSSSPFRCIASLVQQMNLEQDQELTMARVRVEGLESLVASRQKEICMLNTRLAAAESMTHDVIRDLLGVKLDMTNYANLIDQHQVQKFMEAAQQQTEESLAKEQEIHMLREQIKDLNEERESCHLEINKKHANLLSAQITIQQFEERDQLLTAQNEMLKMDKTNVTRRVAELDEMVKKLLEMQNAKHSDQMPERMKEQQGFLRVGDADLTNKLAHSEKLLSIVNSELARYTSGGIHPRNKTDEHAFETKYRNRKSKLIP
ncbi:kinesin-like protein KIN-12C isoform X2 [Malania oleifera]|uniref:kinesin-like protein KIN-12C isoform X2 n=1 Tax=Malania oleifera TaxID=397392 RepID=UPI0025ADC5EB|nr:kinesin-like protein KIN-12C isoform X2 [Malania oleifera]